MINISGSGISGKGYPELVVNGMFSAWTDDDPDGWTDEGEEPGVKEISEVGDGEGYGGSGKGCCNFYSNAPDVTIAMLNAVSITTLIVGRTYRVSVRVVRMVNGGLDGLYFYEYNHTQWETKILALEKIYTWTFVATHTDMRIRIRNKTVAANVTIDNVSVKLEAA